MASTNTTANLGLNQWLGTDSPKMADFNSDNLKIDTAIQSHIADAVKHLNSSDRNRLISGITVGSYLGSGIASRVINIGYQPKAAIIFAANEPPFTYDLVLRCYIQRIAIFTASGNTSGISTTSNGFKLVQQDTSITDNSTIVRLNTNNALYCYILLR